MPGYCSLTLLYTVTHTHSQSPPQCQTCDSSGSTATQLLIPSHHPNIQTRANCTYREYSHKHSYRPHSTGNISTLAARLRCRCVCTAYRCVYIEVVYRLLDDVCRQQFNTVCDCEKLWAAHFNANCGSTKTFRILSSPVKCAVLLNKQKKLCLVFRQTDKKKTLHKQ